MQRLCAAKALGSTIKSVNVSSDNVVEDGVNWKQPVILRFMPEVITDGPMAADVQAFTVKWKLALERAETGRGHRVMSDPGASRATEMFSKVFKDKLGISEDKVKSAAPVLYKEIKAVTFAITANKKSHGIETAFMTTIRLGCKGTRELFCMPGVQLVKYLESTSPTHTKPTMKQISAFLKDITTEQANKFQDASKDEHLLFQGTLGPQDALVLPAGWAFGERVKGGTSSASAIRSSMPGTSTRTSLS